MSHSLQSSSLGLSVLKGLEDFSSNEVTVTVEWTLLNSQLYYQQLLHNVSISADPQPKTIMFAGNMRVQLVLSYNTLYNVSVTQPSTCQQLVRTKFLQLDYSKLYNIHALHQADNNDMNLLLWHVQTSVVIQWN